MFFHPLSGVTCARLSVSGLQGIINYNPNDSPNLFVDTVAQYDCNFGFQASGTGMRTCTYTGSSSVGVWSGNQVTCEGNFICTVV